MSSGRKDTIGSLRSAIEADPLKLYDRLSLENTEIGESVRAYASAPDAIDCDTRSSFREDSAIAVVATLLASCEGNVNIADLCCGVASLARRITTAVAECDRICFWAVDRDPVSVDTVRSDSEAFTAFKTFTVVQREIADLCDLHELDLIVINNTFHELAPSAFAQILSVLNNTLNVARGRVAIVDMEELPQNAPEAIAITWTADEIGQILTAGGFKPVVTRHQKSVNVYRAEFTHIPTVNERATLVQMDLFLRAKLQAALLKRRKLRVDDRSSPDEVVKWVVETGTVARLADELELIGARLRILPG